MEGYVYAIATMDTKCDELLYLVRCLAAAGVAVRTIDVSAAESRDFGADVSPTDLMGQEWDPRHVDRGEAIASLSHALASFLEREAADNRLQGVIGIGGSGGTALITHAMRRLRIGLPKLMVSTVASGNTLPYVDCSDILMMPSVIDIAGVNAVSRTVLGNAAHAMAGMVTHRMEESAKRPTLGMTMFGVTTPCVTRVRQHFEQQGYDCLVFHATGTGGRAMESLVQSQMIEGVLDITTTEVADEVVGGIFPAGEKRFDVLIEQGVPLVISVGALDMVNFGGLDSVPPEFRQRNLHVHNTHVTLMRTTPEECVLIAQWMARKLNRARAPFALVIPEKGISALDAPGQPFHDPNADAVLFAELERQIEPADSRRILRSPTHINDVKFSQFVIEQYENLVADSGSSPSTT